MSAKNIQTHLDKNQFTARVLTDLRLASDSVYFDILLTKLYHYEVRGLSKDWFCSYPEKTTINPLVTKSDVFRDFFDIALPAKQVVLRG